MSSRPMSWKSVTTEAKLLLIGIPLLLWTIIPVYHMFLFSISTKDSATSGRLWPKHPTLQNFEHVFGQSAPVVAWSFGEIANRNRW